MIRAIAAIDIKQGVADSHGIPWQGKLPTDVQYFRTKTIGRTLLMGYGWYSEREKPLPERRNLVATTSDEPLKPGFEPVRDAVKFLKNAKEDIWVGGGANLFATTLDVIDELYITQLQGDWHCTKFFPPFKDKFVLMSESPPQTENGITFTYQVWRHK